MSFTAALAAAEAASGSQLCVGLDPEPARFPTLWRGRPSRTFDFCAEIVDATKDLVCAFKPQVAHFSAIGAEDQLERLLAHIRDVAPGVPVILDAKRGDIGSTAERYAAEAFVRYGADATTVSPYLGFDSIEPYLAHAGRGVILLCRTSNPGGDDLQSLTVTAPDGRRERLFERVARLAASTWAQGDAELGLVVGGTYPGELAAVRTLAPTLPILVPGIGAQGGDAAAAMAAGHRRGPDGATTGPVVISTSRAVLYASGGQDFADAARAAALATRDALRAATGSGEAAGLR